MKSPVITNIWYVFLALLITLVPAACDLPAEPTAKALEKEERPESPKVWKWSRLTEGPTSGGNNPLIRGLSLDPHTSVLSLVTYANSTDRDVASISIRQFLIPSNRNLFPLRFYTGKNGSDNLDTKIRMCDGLVGRSICSTNHFDLNDVVFDNQGKMYILDSTGDVASNNLLRIIAFTINFRGRNAHPREVLAGGKLGGADGTGTNASFNEGVRNMALSTDKKYIYVADWKNNSVRAVEIESKKVTTLKPTDKEGKPFGLPRPTGMAVGKGNMVYTIRNSGGVGTIAALTVPLPLLDDNAVRARALTLTDEKGSPYQLRFTSNPVWYIAVDDSGVLYTYTERAGALYIVRIRLKDAKAEDLVGVVSEVAAAKGVDRVAYMRGLEVSGDGKNIYYASDYDVYAYSYE